MGGQSAAMSIYLPNRLIPRVGAVRHAGRPGIWGPAAAGSNSVFPLEREGAAPNLIDHQKSVNNVEYLRV
jgi:hypothetical protein